MSVLFSMMVPALSSALEEERTVAVLEIKIPILVKTPEEML